MVTLLTAAIGLLMQIVPSVISFFAKSEAEKQQALKDFYSAVAAHANDGLTSAAERQNYQSQLDDLKAAADAAEAAKEKA